MSTKDPFGFVDTGGPDTSRFGAEAPGDPAEWYMKKPRLEIEERPDVLPLGHVRLEDGSVVTFEEAARRGDLRAAAFARACGDDAWAGMCEHMRALWLLIEASPINLSGGYEGLDMDCRECGRGAIGVELARDRTKP